MLFIFFEKWVEGDAALQSPILFRNIHVANALDFVMEIWGSIEVSFNREGKEKSAISQHSLKLKIVKKSSLKKWDFMAVFCWVGRVV